MDLLNTLLEIQDLDLRKSEIEKQSASIPEQKKAIVATLKKDKLAYEALNTQQKEAEKLCKDLTHDTDKLRQQKAKIMIQSGETKDNSTYTKLIKEAESYDARVDDMESQFLEQLDKVEDIKKQKKDIAGQLKSMISKIEQDIKDLDLRHKNLVATLPETEAKRNELAKLVDEETLIHYDKVFQSKGGLRAVIVPITHDDSCGFCHLKLSAKDIASAAKGLGECLECGAFLHK
ncbi:hypothetical protein LNTAR_14227 [Lentisphaera araneosa HTCC2155]|uniref:CT398-like coiled coil hairpin domain-containing protein n=1 Tax=Lentisphaera araneosa HTCC2155 TaxID=313628 RepID=A6DH97_9BACT|nr:hypothetical protein [Lentisphaera araneosa]EDM28980.1 hypothetical protein LNTAR_14227 [Lentisphaera araneosa HTCC2155]